MMNQKKTVEMLEASAQNANLLTERPSSQWALTARRFRSRRSGMAGLGIVLLLLTMSVNALAYLVRESAARRAALA